MKFQGIPKWAGFRAVIGSLALFIAVPAAQAQDTTATSRDSIRDTTQAAGYRAMERSADQGSARDTNQLGSRTDQQGVAQNPPGYRGMERPVNVFPLDTGAVVDSAAGADATSRVGQMRRQESADSGNQNPPGYRGMERPAALDSAQQQAVKTSGPCPPAAKAGKKATDKQDIKDKKPKDSASPSTR